MSSKKELMIQIIIDGLRAEQEAAETPCVFTALAIGHLEEAIRQLQKRTRRVQASMKA